MLLCPVPVIAVWAAQGTGHRAGQGSHCFSSLQLCRMVRTNHLQNFAPNTETTWIQSEHLLEWIGRAIQNISSSFTWTDTLENLKKGLGLNFELLILDITESIGIFFWSHSTNWEVFLRRHTSSLTHSCSLAKVKHVLAMQYLSVMQGLYWWWNTDFLISEGIGLCLPIP